MAEETTTTLGFMSDEYVAGVLKHSRELQGRIASLESQLSASQRALTMAMGELRECRERLLQSAALSVALIGIIDRNGVPWDASPDAPPSNLPQYAAPGKGDSDG